MSIAEFYTENCIDSEWDAPNGMDNFLRANAAAESWGTNNRKRGRHEGDDEQHDALPPDPADGGFEQRQSNESNNRPAKRVKHGDEELVQFDVPFPCAFLQRRGGCRFRSTCSYHHGAAIPCLCDSPHCPRGHPHRRAPQRCIHGATYQCRWACLGECSFHHGIAETCRCERTDCPRAHPTRVRKNGEARLERSRELARTRPEFADQNARKLFLGMPKDGGPFTEADVKEKFSCWIRIASAVKVEGDAIMTVRIDPERKFAFIEFRNAEIATACISYLDGLVFQGWGKVKLERPRVFDPSTSPCPGPGPVVTFDVSKLDHLRTKTSKNAMRQKKTKKKAKSCSTSDTKEKARHYRTWRKEQRSLKTGETGQQLRQRYIQLFPGRK